MLARLDEELAPLRASVNREGSLLRIEGPQGSGDPSRVAEVVEAAGYIAQPFEGDADVARWFGMDEVSELSLDEAHILAERWSAELVDEGVIVDARELLPVLGSALLATFSDAARTGEIGVVDVDMADLRAVLGEDEARAVRAWIKTRLGHPTAARPGGCRPN